MKKRYIGCIVILVIVVGGLGYLAMQLGPAIMAAVESREGFVEDLDRLDAEHPFTPDPALLDVRGFEKTLDLRVELRESFQANVRGLQAREEALTQDDLGFFERLSSALELWRTGIEGIGPTLEEIPSALRTAGMGPSEFVYYNRVLLATLERIDALGGEDMQGLVGRYAQLEEEYAQMPRMGPEVPTLDELVGHVDLGLLEQAENVVATNENLVINGLSSAEFEYLYLVLLSEEFRHPPEEGDEAESGS